MIRASKTTMLMRKVVFSKNIMLEYVLKGVMKADEIPLLTPD
jgi:hypothetical protein